MKTQAWTFLTALTLLAGISVNAQGQDQSGRVKIADSKITQTQGGSAHVIGQPLENSGSAQLVPQQNFSPNNYSGGQVTLRDQPMTSTMPEYLTGGYNQQSRLPPGVMTHPQTDDPFQVQFGVDQRVGGLQGYNGSYTGLRMFAPFATSDGSLWFIEPRINITDDGAPGANVGIGHRMYSPYYDAVQSISGWWDYDDGHEFNYQQFGLSYSYLTRYWRFRANGYQVTSENNRLLSSQNIGELYYQNNFILQNRLSQIETAYNGVDAELGGPIPVLGVYGLNWAAGAYYLEGVGDEDAVGVKGRVEAQINEDWQMNVSISEDKLFGTNVQLGVQVNIADAMPARWFRQYDMYKYLSLPEERNYRVNTRVSSHISEDQLINPADGNPFCVAHIIPDAVGPAVPAGDGTIENPFNSLDAYRDAGLNPTPENCDIILVRGSDATGTNLQHGITIFERQRLLAASSTHEITGLINGASVTDFLPNTGTGVTPVIFNTFDPPGVNTSVVTIDPSLTIAQDSLTEISGFQINGTSGGVGSPLNIGINGVGALDGGLDVNRNTFLNTRIGVNFINSSAAQAIVDTNTFTGAGSSSLFGININQSGGTTLSLLLDNNTVTNFIGEDANNNGALDVGEDTGLPDGTLAANGLLDQGIGIQVVADGAGTVINANDSGNADNPLGITNNTVTGNGSGIRVVSQAGADQNLDFLTNNFSNNLTPVGIDASGAGITMQSDAAGSVINVNRFRNNTVNSNAGNGAVILASNTGAINFLDPDADNEAFDGNTFNSNGAHGMFVSADNGTVTFNHFGSDTNPASSNTFNSNTLNGLLANISNGGNFTITEPVNNVTFNTNTANGVHVIVDGPGSIFSAQFGDLILGSVGNQFNGNGDAVTGLGDGFLLTATDNPTVTLSFFNSQFNENQDDGLEINLNNMLVTGLNGMTISDNQFLSNINGNGIHFVTDAADINNLTISDNNAGGPPGGSSGNGLSGLFFNLANGSTLDTASIDGNNLQDNDQHGIHYQVSDSSVLMNTITGNIITSQDNGNGIFIDDITDPLIGIDILGFSFADNEITNNAGAGVLGNINSADITALFTGNTITGNTDEGIGFSLVNSSNFFSNEFDDNTISENGSYGLRLSGVDNTNITIDTAGLNGPNVLDSNVDAGILLELADNATGTLLVENTTITNTTNGANPLDAGEGVHLRLTDNSIINDASFNNSESSNNAGAGYRVNALANSELTNLTIDTSLFNENGANGLALNREGNALIGRNTNGGSVTLTDSSFTNNTGDGINVVAIGTSVVDVNDVTVNVNGSGLTITGNTDDGVGVDLDTLSSANVSLSTSEVSNNDGNGIEIVTDTQAVFRNVGAANAPVVFDGLLVNNNGQNGYSFTIFDESAQFVNILGNAQQATISNNALNGILYNAISLNNSTINVGDGSTTPATPGTDAVPDVVIAGNLQDGMNILNASSGLVTYTVDNVELTGNRTTGLGSDDGIDLSVTGTSIFDSMIFTVQNTSITNFNDDGFVLNHNSTANNGSTGTLLTIANTVVGADDFNFNGGDGIVLNVDDDGAVIDISGSIVNRNVGDGIRFTTTAEGVLGDGNLNGTVVPVADPANGVNNNWFNVGGVLTNRIDFFGGGFVGGFGADIAGTPPRLVYEINGFRNTTSNLSITSTDMNFNGGNGLELNVGTSSEQIVSLQDSNLFGNSAEDFFTQSFASFQLANASVNRGDGLIDDVVMDNAAQLTLDFGAIAPNSGNRINTLGTGNGTHTNADGFKGNNRPTLLQYIVTVPDELLNPNPNNFVDIGGPINEALSFPNRGSTNIFATSPDNITIVP